MILHSLVPDKKLKKKERNQEIVMMTALNTGQLIGCLVKVSETE